MILLLAGARGTFVGAGLCTALAAVGAGGVAHLARGLATARDGGLFNFVGFFLVFQLQEVGYIEEGVALQAHVHKGGLHAGQHPGDAAVIDGPRQGVLVFAFVVDLRELIVFQDCQPRFMRR